MADSRERILDSGDGSIYDIHAKAPGPRGSLPLTPAMLRERPSGELFGWSHDVGMGWKPEDVGGNEIFLLSTHGGIRDAEGKPIALGYHTGHWEVGLLMQAAAEELKANGIQPFVLEVVASPEEAVAAFLAGKVKAGVPFCRCHE